MADVPGPLDLLTERATDYLLAFSALHGQDATVLGRDLLELLATTTISYLVDAANQRGLGDQLTTLLAHLVVQDPVT